MIESYIAAIIGWAIAGAALYCIHKLIKISEKQEV
jgi:hypothetical protein|tara:strand:- start:406 stop:510 length:105 start_codon:yes stop_codon:yes gene_type:complete